MKEGKKERKKERKKGRNERRKERRKGGTNKRTCSVGVIILTGENQSTWKKTSPSATLPTQSSTLTGSRRYNRQAGGYPPEPRHCLHQ
jgi:hypothetical protein